ncbi:transglutaminaseTgpA domain-containing protein [Alkalibacillus aidingensis]|uniref:transglutaminaseTgpA domain-containing protein n=1 Tax=Alkalibacillus aidingensis TaxID=2747607 RepID=UPI0016612BFC|nr:transglutaminaseTgpA domain-containing protein [Alkalibacillus aidingensis]
MRLKEQDHHYFINILLYVGSMLLLMEWIYPLDQVTDTGQTYAFFTYVLLCFMITSMHKLPTWLASAFKFLGLMFLVHYLFYETRFFSFEWIQSLLIDLQMNLSAIVSQNWMNLTPVFRTLLFLILLWMMSYLLYYWFVVAKRPFAFILFTFIYITVLDTFTVYDSEVAIVRVFVISLAILGLANLNRVLSREQLKLPHARTMFKWVSPIVFVILFSAVMGYAAPKLEPQWPDPVPFLQGAAENGFGNGNGSGVGVNRVGYGENDERLGGGFIMDNSTVFYATTNTSQYWKVETKDIYTGHGWVNSDNDQMISQPNGSIPDMSQYGDVVERVDISSELRFVEPGNLNKIPYLYGTENISANEVVDDLNYRFNLDNGVLESLVDHEATLLDSGYEIAGRKPDFPINSMKEVPSSSEEVPKETYLQLPESLPDRVGELAEDIIADVDDNRYDQAKAIEEYFSDEGFVYETSDVAVPSDDEDYVDQFLFDTQRGYCDNFSTAMVVMLRSLDIPARWAKGFTGGDRAYNQDVFPDAGANVYEIQNNNAHSWVEVYFDDIGWVPFEPTVGFQNQADFATGESIEDILDRNEEDYLEAPDANVPDEESNDSQSNDEETEDDEVAGTGSNFWTNLSNQMTWFNWLIVTVIVGLSIWLINSYRDQIIAHLKKQKLKRKHDADTISGSYQYILKLLAKEGYVLQEGQTLREFADDIDRFLGSREMSKLTNIYERFVYRGEDLETKHDEVYGLWNQLIQRLLSNRT